MSNYNTIFATALAAVWMGGAQAAAPAAQQPAHAGHAAPAAAAVQGTGIVKAVDARAGSVTIAHDAIKSLKWPAMTMPFKVTHPALLEQLPAGAKVQFTLVSGKDPRISALQILTR